MASDDTSILGRDWPRRPAIATVVAIVLLVVGLLAHQVILPEVIHRTLEREIRTARADATAQLTVGSVALNGLTGLTLRDVELDVDASSETVPTPLTIDRISTAIRPSHALTGELSVASLNISGGTVRLHRLSDGTTTLSLLPHEDENESAELTDQRQDQTATLRHRVRTLTDRLLGPFGGVFPHIRGDGDIHFSASSNVTPWSLDRIELPQFSLQPLHGTTDGERASLETTTQFHPREGEASDSTDSAVLPGMQWPDEITVSGKLARPVWESTGRLTASPAVKLSRVGPADRLNVSVQSLFVEPGPTVGAEDLSAEYRLSNDVVPLFSLDSGAVEWPQLRQRGLLPELQRLEASGADIQLNYEAIGRSPWHDLLELTRRKSANHVVNRAEGIARSVADRRADDETGDSPTPERTSAEEGPDSPTPDSATAASNADEPESATDAKWFAAGWMDLIPEIIELEEINVDLRDGRNLPVDPFSEHIALEDGRLSAGLHPDRGDGTLKVTFDALDLAANAGSPKNGQPNTDSPVARRNRGSVELIVSAKNWGDEINVETDIRSLSIPWLSQMLGAQAAKSLRTGTMSADISSSSEANSSRHSFTGKLAATELTLFHQRLAGDPIDSIDGRYVFEGYWDPSETPAPPELLPRRADSYRTKTDSSGDADNKRARGAESNSGSSDLTPDASTADATGLAPDEIRDGVLHVSKGQLNFEGLEFSFRPSLSGLSSAGRPSRLDIAVDLPETRLQAMVDAVPDALLGPLDGTELRGSFGWSFRTEIPLFEAGEMQWKSQPRTQGIQLVHLPRAVDVRDLEDAFQHTAQNPGETYERSLRIPEMKPTPAPWLLENAEMTLGEIDSRRRDRRWPEPPSAGALPNRLPTYDPPESLRRRRSRVVTDERIERQRQRWRQIDAPTRRPEVWLTEAATRRAANAPWADANAMWFLPDERLRRYGDDRLKRVMETFRSRAKTSDHTNSAVGFSHPSPGVTLNRPTSDDGWDALQTFLGEEPSVAERSASSDEDTAHASTRLDAGWFGREPQLPSELAETAVGRYGEPTERILRLNPYGPYHFAPLHHISKWMTRAIMTFEDNSFFEHNGFNWHAIQESVEANLEAGGFARGASTISMQLVKNVYLNFDKVLARKLREVFLVWLMENVVDVPKARILEVYFNVIEFGPGVFGIHDAAAHYFGKRPDDLTLMESVWLVSIIPNPPERHRQWERGQISPGWARNLRSYVEIMHDRDRLSTDQKEAAISSIPEFFKPRLHGLPLRATFPDRPPPSPSNDDGSTSTDE